MGPFSDSDRKKLEKNPNVLKVTKSNVTYKSEFKISSVKKLLKGATYKEIFEDSGIDLTLFGEDYAKKTLSRWRKIYQDKGKKGLTEERRGLGSTGRPKGLKFKSLEEENAYLRAEIDFLKKLSALEELEERAAKKQGSH